MKKFFLLAVCLTTCLACSTSFVACSIAFSAERDTGTNAEAVLGNMAKLGVTEETLNSDLKDVYFAISPFTSIKFFDTLNSMLAALNSGSIVAFCTDEYTADYLISRTGMHVKFRPAGLPVYNLNFSMLLREEDAELCEHISSVIRDMKADGTMNALKKKYIEDCIAGTDPEALKALKALKAVQPENLDGTDTLKVAIALTGDRPPMDYVSEAGEPIGFNTALVSEIAKRLNKNAKFISVDTGARAILLNSKGCDVVFWCEAGDFNNREGSDSEDQPEHTLITEPYLSCTEVYVTLATSPLLKKKWKNMGKIWEK